MKKPQNGRFIGGIRCKTVKILLLIGHQPPRFQDFGRFHRCKFQMLSLNFHYKKTVNPQASTITFIP
jgi:hypothetical protein